MKKPKTRNLINNNVLSLREQALVDKEKLNHKVSELDKKIKSIETDKTKTDGLCDFGQHNNNFNGDKSL